MRFRALTDIFTPGCGYAQAGQILSSTPGPGEIPMRYGNELEKATAQLAREGLVQRDQRRGERGPAAEGWRVAE